MVAERWPVGAAQLNEAEKRRRDSFSIGPIASPDSLLSGSSGRRGSAGGGSSGRRGSSEGRLSFTRKRNVRMADAAIGAGDDAPRQRRYSTRRASLAQASGAGMLAEMLLGS